MATDGIEFFQYGRDGACREKFEPGVEYTRPEPTTPWWNRLEAALAACDGDGEGAGMASVLAALLDRPGITLDDATFVRSRPGLTLTEDDTPSAPPGATYAGEGSVHEAGGSVPLGGSPYPVGIGGSLGDRGADCSE
jgi:hypothetical protein